MIPKPNVRGLGDYLFGLRQPYTYYGTDINTVNTTSVYPPAPGDSAVITNDNQVNYYIFVGDQWVEITNAAAPTNQIYSVNYYHELPELSVGDAAIGHVEYAYTSGSELVGNFYAWTDAKWRIMHTFYQTLPPTNVGERNGDFWYCPKIYRWRVHPISVGSNDSWGFVGNSKISSISPPDDGDDTYIYAGYGDLQDFTFSTPEYMPEYTNPISLSIYATAKSNTSSLPRQIGITQISTIGTPIETILTVAASNYTTVNTYTVSANTYNTINPLSSNSTWNMIMMQNLQISLRCNSLSGIRCTTLYGEIGFQRAPHDQAYIYLDGSWEPFLHWKLP